MILKGFISRHTDPVIHYGAKRFFTTLAWDMLLALIVMIAVGKICKLLLPDYFEAATWRRPCFPILSSILTVWWVGRALLRTLLETVDTEPCLRPLRGSLEHISNEISVMPTLAPLLLFGALLGPWPSAPTELFTAAVSIGSALLAAALYAFALRPSAPGWLRRAYAWATPRKPLQAAQLLCVLAAVGVIVLLRSQFFGHSSY